jgi:hypothetical protein
VIIMTTAQWASIQFVMWFGIAAIKESYFYLAMSGCWLALWGIAVFAEVAK